MRKKKVIAVLEALLVPVLLVVFWQVGGSLGWFKTTAISIPSKIWEKALDMILRGTLQANILISIKRILLGFVIGTFLGIIFGVLLGAFKKVNHYLRLVLDLLRPIPIIVWVPVLILWIGIGENTKITVIAIGTFWPVFLNVLDGVQNVSTKYMEVATIFCKDRKETVVKVIVPAAIPHLITGIKIASGNALMGVVGAEMFASSSGIGYLVAFSRDMNQPAAMMVGVITIAIMGALVNLFIQYLNNKSREKKE